MHKLNILNFLPLGAVHIHISNYIHMYSSIWYNTVANEPELTQAVLMYCMCMAEQVNDSQNQNENF